ncbi:MAG: Crp/Fnr family transcriptional regulator [Bacteroidetes bacterium]|nr:MAG: Crp/Fnr family transcriptional regulator [Bacteroidota bacterium]
MSTSQNQYQDLFSFCEQFVQFSENEKKCFAELLTYKQYQKGDTITEIGSIEQNLSFISSGIVRGYCMRGNDDITLCIEFSNSFVSAYSSFTEQTPTKVGLEALTDVTLYEIKYEHLNTLYEGSKEGERMGRYAAEQMSSIYERRLINLLTKSATDRYEELLMNEPQLMLTIPQKYIAEYLGIQPESLSRLKKQAMT